MLWHVYYYAYLTDKKTDFPKIKMLLTVTVQIQDLNLHLSNPKAYTLPNIPNHSNILFNVIYSFSFILKAMLKRPFPFLCNLIGWAFLSIILTLAVWPALQQSTYTHGEMEEGEEPWLTDPDHQEYKSILMHFVLMTVHGVNSFSHHLHHCLIGKVNSVHMQYFWSEKLISESKIKAE